LQKIKFTATWVPHELSESKTKDDSEITTVML
jgi:hypothetical protein